MKKIRVSLIKILTVLLISIISISIFAEPYYTVNNLKIEARINSDGSVDVTELAQYNAYDVNGILYNIDYKGYGELKNLNVFYEKDSEFIQTTNNDTKNKGTYTLKDSDDLTEIKLYFPMTEEKRRDGFFLSIPFQRG